MSKNYCNEIYNDYFSKLEEPIFCRGWEKDFPHPDNVDGTFLKEWFIYIEYYRIL